MIVDRNEGLLGSVKLRTSAIADARFRRFDGRFLVRQFITALPSVCRFEESSIRRRFEICFLQDYWVFWVSPNDDRGL